MRSYGARVALLLGVERWCRGDGGWYDEAERPPLPGRGGEEKKGGGVIQGLKPLATTVGPGGAARGARCPDVRPTAAMVCATALRAVAESEDHC